MSSPIQTELKDVAYDPNTDRFTLPLVLSGAYFRAMVSGGAPLLGTVRLMRVGELNTLVLEAVDGEVTPPGHNEEPAPRLEPPAPVLPDPQPGIAEQPPESPPPAAVSGPRVDAVPVVGMDAVPVQNAPWAREDDPAEDALPSGESVREKIPKPDVGQMVAAGVVPVDAVGMPPRPKKEE